MVRDYSVTIMPPLRDWAILLVFSGYHNIVPTGNVIQLVLLQKKNMFQLVF